MLHFVMCVKGWRGGEGEERGRGGGGEGEGRGRRGGKIWEVLR